MKNLHISFQEVSMRLQVVLLCFFAAILGGASGCVSRPDTPAATTTDRTTINAPTVVNQPLPGGPQMSFQVTQDPNNPGRGWVLVGNQPVAVRMESGVWVFDTSTSTPSPPPTPPTPPVRGGLSGAPPVAPPSTPPGYMSPTMAQELLIIDQIDLYRTLLARMKILAANAQVSSVDEFNVMITRLEGILREMERLQHQQQQPQPQPQQQSSSQPCQP